MRFCGSYVRKGEKIPPEMNPKNFPFIRFLDQGGFGATVLAEGGPIRHRLPHPEPRSEDEEKAEAVCVVAFLFDALG